MTELINQIAAFTAPNVFNPWRDTDPLDIGDGHPERRDRLLAHFQCEPEYLLVGEAPGYQGCHFSGVPFTNESLIFNDQVPRVSCGRFTSRASPWCEPSATIVWKQLHALDIAHVTVMWNAFAWHPHKPGEPMSNRAPTRQELAAGAPVLKAVLERFKGAKVIAVGKVAANLLASFYVKLHGTVRHPSMGGANQFREELYRLTDTKGTP